MKLLTLFSMLFMVPAYAQEKITLSCNEIQGFNLTQTEHFSAALSAYIVKSNGSIPSRGKAVSKLVLTTDSNGTGVLPIDKILESYLSQFKISLEDWDLISAFTVPADARFGTSEFANRIQHMGLDQKVIVPLTKMNKSVQAIRSRLETRLYELETESIEKNFRFLSEKELNELLVLYTRNPDLSIKTLSLAKGAPGVPTVQSWRGKFLAENPKVRDNLKKKLINSFVEQVQNSKEIPERDATVIETIAGQLLGDNPNRYDMIGEFFGKNQLFTSVDDFIEEAKTANPKAFEQAVDKRIYTQAYHNKLITRFKKSDQFITFKLIQNADFPAFPYVENFSRMNGNSPMLASPAFNQLDSVPTKLDYLFSHPNVFIQTQPIFQYSKDFYVVNNGASDKIVNPLSGVFKYVDDPLAKVLVQNPQTRSETVPNAYYGLSVGYRMTTGSLNEPAFNAAYVSGLKTDLETAGLLENNASFTVVSRSYQNPAFAGLANAANATGARRVSFTKARYGNPAGLFDMCKIYTKDSAIKIKSLPALVLGDLHHGVTDPAKLKGVINAMLQMGMLKKNPRFGEFNQYEYIPGDVKVENIILHDAPDDLALNGHTIDQALTRARADIQGLLNIVDHFQSTAGVINLLKKIMPDTKFVFTVDNHGTEWVIKALQRLDLKQFSPNNHPILLRLAKEAMTIPNLDPYERLFQIAGIEMDNVVFLKKGESYRVGVDYLNPDHFSILNNGKNVGPHGQQGQNGAKSIGLAKMYESTGPSTNGHYHTSGEFGNSTRVGSLTNDVQGYHNGGPSTGDASIILVYSDEASQLLRYENGTFVPNAENQDPNQFFTQDLPRYKPKAKTVDGAKNEDHFINPSKTKKSK